MEQVARIDIRGGRNAVILDYRIRSYGEEWHDPEDDLTCKPTPEALRVWIDRHWKDWYVRPMAELQHRVAIRGQALGVAYAAHDLEVPARYEVHLDRKLERTLAMLIRLSIVRFQSPLISR